MLEEGGNVFSNGTGESLRTPVANIAPMATAVCWSNFSR